MVVDRALPAGIEGHAMLWTFCRDGDRLRYEVRLDLNGSHCALILKYPGGRETAERFATSDELGRRALEVQQQLLDEGWWLAE